MSSILIINVAIEYPLAMRILLELVRLIGETEGVDALQVEAERI